MKLVIKITALAIAAIVALSFLGWVLAINKVWQFVEQYIAVSSLDHAEIQPSPLQVVKVKFNAIAPSAPIANVISTDRPNYQAMSRAELRKHCKGSGIKNWANLSKQQLIEALSAIAA